MDHTERKLFTKEFKLDVIQQSYRRDNIKELAHELGLRPALIYKWRATYQVGKDTTVPVFTGNGVEALTPEEQKMRALRKENAELRMERDILKKAIGIFGKSDG